MASAWNSLRSSEAGWSIRTGRYFFLVFLLFLSAFHFFSFFFQFKTKKWRIKWKEICVYVDTRYLVRLRVKRLIANAQYRCVLETMVPRLPLFATPWLGDVTSCSSVSPEHFLVFSFITLRSLADKILFHLFFTVSGGESSHQESHSVLRYHRLNFSFSIWLVFSKKFKQQQKLSFLTIFPVTSVQLLFYFHLLFRLHHIFTPFHVALTLF